jgi:hypothetical protein
MKFGLSILALSLATFASAAPFHAARTACSEAERFGVLTVSPSSLTPGQVSFPFVFKQRSR